MQRRTDAQMTDEQFAKEGFLISSDPCEHVERIRAMERAGATVVCLQLIGRANPLGSIRTYGERVLPALRKAANRILTRERGGAPRPTGRRCARAAAFRTGTPACA